MERVGSAKIPVIRLLRAETSLGLIECKHVADSGGVVAQGLTISEADRLVGLLRAAGATATRLDPTPEG
jgi:ribosomal protein L7/L12